MKFMGGEVEALPMVTQEAKMLTDFWGPPGSVYHYALISPFSEEFHKLIHEGSITATNEEFFTFHTNDLTNPTHLRDETRQCSDSNLVLLCLHLPNPENSGENQLPPPETWHRSITLAANGVLPAIKTKRIFAGSIRAVIAPEEVKDEVKAQLLESTRSYANGLRGRLLVDAIAQMVGRVAAKKSSDIVVSEEGWREYVGESNPFTIQEEIERNIAQAHQERDPGVTGIINLLEQAAEEAGAYYYKNAVILPSHAELIQSEGERVKRELFVSKHSLRSWGDVPAAREALHDIANIGEQARVLHELAALLYWRKKGTHGFDSQNFLCDFGINLKSVAEKYILLKQCANDSSLSLRGTESRREVIAYSIMRELPNEVAYVNEKATELLWFFEERARNAGTNSVGGRVIKVMTDLLRSELNRPLPGALKMVERERVVQQILERINDIKPETIKGLEFLSGLTTEALRYFSDATLLILLKTTQKISEDK